MRKKVNLFFVDFAKNHFISENYLAKKKSHFSSPVTLGVGATSAALKSKPLFWWSTPMMTEIPPSYWNMLVFELVGPHPTKWKCYKARPLNTCHGPPMTSDKISIQRKKKSKLETENLVVRPVVQRAQAVKAFHLPSCHFYSISSISCCTYPTFL